jgi:DNA-binding transcriptional regulator YdaS (Cro superfamily)
MADTETIHAASALEVAIDMCGGLTELAKRINSKPQVIVNWRRRGVPPERCGDIERATGGVVTRSQLRPDIFGDQAA